MALKKHHRWLIGSFTSLILIFMVTISIFTYMLFIRQEVNYNLLNEKITDSKNSLQSQINLISEDLMGTQTLLEESQQELSSLKASIGEDFSGIYSDAVDSVVIVATNTGQGTGFIIDRDGYIVTNYHIMEGATAAGIYTSSGGPYDVQEVIGIDSVMDIALLKVEENFQKLTLGDSDDVDVGEKVIAIGNPYGLQFSATVGSISQIHREGPNGLEIYLQIDAAVNPGNSGGPVIDKDGKVIGMVNFKVRGAEGLGFALESNYIKEAVNDIYQQTSGENLI
jgi:S1-C subfamily serine protease